jgi:hypothetical protein
MPDNRPWYRESETFIAAAALVVSISAVVVGLYEAALQRRHDRAEVWPRVEISTFILAQGAVVRLENTGIGPAVIKSISVSVDGKPQRTWDDALRTLYAHDPPTHSSTTVAEHAVRAGDQVTLVGLAKADLPPDFWHWIGRVSMRVCYSSVFDEAWVLSDAHLGGSSKWQQVKSCSPQPTGIDL